MGQPPMVKDNNCMKYHAHPSDLWKEITRMFFFLCVNCDLDLCVKPIVKVTVLLYDILSGLNMVVRSYIPDTVFGMCALDLDLGDMILDQGHDTSSWSHGKQLC